MDYLGVRIGTIVKDNVSLRCDGCLEIIEGTPWRMNILDVVAAETPVNWTERPPINPGPFEFHPDPAHVRQAQPAGWNRIADSQLARCRHTRTPTSALIRP